MSLRLKDRVRAYKDFLKQRIAATKGMEFRVKLTKPKAKDFVDFSDRYYPGVTISNPSRDVRELTGYTKKFDAEFTFLYFGQTVPEFIEQYSENYIARLIRQCLNPDHVNEKLRAIHTRGLKP